MNELLSLLEHDARRPLPELAGVLKRSEYEVEKEIKALEKERIILGYNTLIDWNKAGTHKVTAFIEVNLTPQRDVGFDAIADRISRFDEVRSVFLMSGSFDLLVIVEEESLQSIRRSGTEDPGTVISGSFIPSAASDSPLCSIGPSHTR